MSLQRRKLLFSIGSRKLRNFYLFTQQQCAKDCGFRTVTRPLADSNKIQGKPSVIKNHCHLLIFPFTKHLQRSHLFKALSLFLVIHVFLQRSLNLVRCWQLGYSMQSIQRYWDFFLQIVVFLGTSCLTFTLVQSHVRKLN